MNENDELRKFGADKIAFLGLFAVSLLIAQIIVSINSTLDFTEPIELSHIGLSIPMPTGKNWQGGEKWQYRDDAFTLRSRFITSTDKVAAGVTCQCFLDLQNMNPENWFENEAAVLNGKIIETYMIQKGNLTIHYAHIEGPISVFLGSAELPNNRRINIEVVQTTFEIDLAQKVFDKIIESLSFKENNPVNTGMEIIDQIQSKGINSVMNDQIQQTCFIIQDSGNNNIGFTIDALNASDVNEQSNIQAATHLYMKGFYAREQATLFRSDNNLRQYLWESEVSQRDGQVGTKIVLDDAGTINIITQINGSIEENNYPNGSKIIPSIFLELLINLIVQNNIQEAVIDMIDANGSITPTLFSLNQVSENTEGSSIVMTLEYLNNLGFSDLLYLNDQKQISRVIIKQNREYNLERTDIESITVEFPEMAGDILRRNEFLKNNVF